MIKRTLTFTLISALLLILTTSNSQLNVKYRHVLTGQGQLTKAIAKEMYEQFRSPYHEKSEYRFSVFFNKLKNIVQHNSDKSNTWLKGVNQFSDMTFEEFKNAKLMAPQNCSATHDFKIERKSLDIPTNFDWLNKGVVTPVKDQGDCGSCWTFSTVGAMESHWNILGKGRNVSFSQQLVDCAGNFNNFGCDGGLPSQAFEYIRYAGGL
jgi:cathepsin H